jgi:hypothetical protein
MVAEMKSMLQLKSLERQESQSDVLSRRRSDSSLTGMPKLVVTPSTLTGTPTPDRRLSGVGGASWDDHVAQATSLSAELSSDLLDVPKAQLALAQCSMMRTELRLKASTDSCMGDYWSWEAQFTKELTNATAIRNIVLSLSKKACDLECDLDVLQHTMALARLLCFKGRETKDQKDLPKPHQLHVQTHFLATSFLADAVERVFALLKSTSYAAQTADIILNTLSSLRFLSCDGPSGLVDGKEARLAILAAGFVEQARSMCKNWASMVALQDNAVLRKIEPEMCQVYQVLVELSKDADEGTNCDVRNRFESIVHSSSSSSSSTTTESIVHFSLTIISADDWAGSAFAQLREQAGFVLCNILQEQELDDYGDLIRESMHKVVPISLLSYTPLTHPSHA